MPTLSAKLSWSHILELLPLKSAEAQLYYAQEVAERNLAVRELRRQISRKAFERREIANAELSEQSIIPFNVLKDPYLLDTLGLNDNYLEADLEKAILADIESFILLVNPSTHLTSEEYCQGGGLKQLAKQPQDN